MTDDLIEIKRDEDGRITTVKVSEGFGCFLFLVGLAIVLTILGHC